jgi:hypothetical protein
VKYHPSKRRILKRERERERERGVRIEKKKRWKLS